MAGELELSVNTLEMMFQKTESNLNHFTRKLDFELKNAGCLDNQNPVKLLEQISDIKKEYSMLVAETKKVQEAQKEMMDYFHDQLANLLKVTKELESRTNYKVSETSDELKALEDLSETIRNASKAPTKDDDILASQKIAPDQSTNTALPVEVPEKVSSLIDFPKSPSTKRKNLTEFLPLTEEEFNQVSNLVRGRAKLEDVNKVYKILWQHFKEEKNKRFLSIKEMHAMGLQISGATGKAKLNILWSLKLLTLNSQGSARIQ